MKIKYLRILNKVKAQWKWLKILLVCLMYIFVLTPFIAFGTVMYRWNAKHALICTIIVLTAILLTKCG